MSADLEQALESLRSLGLTAREPFPCGVCGEPAERDWDFDSLLRCKWDCPNGHVTITIAGDVFYAGAA